MLSVTAELTVLVYQQSSSVRDAFAVTIRQLSKRIESPSHSSFMALAGYLRLV